MYPKVQNFSESMEVILKAYQMLDHTKYVDLLCDNKIDIFPTRILYINIGFASRWFWSLCLSNSKQSKASIFRSSGPGVVGV